MALKHENIRVFAAVNGAKKTFSSELRAWNYAKILRVSLSFSPRGSLITVMFIPADGKYEAFIAERFE